MENFATYRLTQTGPETQAILDQVNENTTDIAQLRALYEALTQSEPVIIQPSDTWPVADPEENVIYRVIDRVNTPPQYYSDYMWNGTAMVLMATYDNAIDSTPTAGSNNPVASGGVLDYVSTNGSAYDISAAHSGTAYEDLAAALGTDGANVPSSVRKGGMSIKFVQTSSNRYVQYRLMAPLFTTDVNQWQGGEILKEETGTTEEFIEITKNNGDVILTINEDGADFVNLKKGGKSVLTEEDEIEQITESDTNEHYDCVIFADDNYDEEEGTGEVYAKIKKEGIYAKGFFDLNGNSISEGLGGDCILQQSRGTYVSINPTHNGTFIKSYYHSNVGKVIELGNVSNISIPVNRFVYDTISVWVNFGNDSLWKRTESPSFHGITFQAILSSGSTVSHTRWSYGFSIGWNLVKIPATINADVESLQIIINSPTSEFTISLGSVVLNQRMFPTINFNADSTYTEDYGVRTELLEYIGNNKIPVDLRIDSSIAPNATLASDGSNAAAYISYLREQGIVNGIIYGNGDATNYSSCLDTIKTNIANRSGQYQVKKIKICGNQWNYLNKTRFDAEKEAGIEIMRDVIGGYLQSSLTNEYPILSTTGVAPSDSTESISDEFIADGISTLKNYIDKIVEFGMIGSIMTHQMVSKNSYSQSRDGGLCGIWEIQREVMDYALQLQSEGKLCIMSMQDMADMLNN